MEKRTIGGLIAALRKANGMTQKDLAERLNVSDKSVSRWERDEGAPDLSLIPVIAEIFGITCDELLRGERKSPAERTETEAEENGTPKGEKERKRMLRVSLSRFKSRSVIALGVALAGLIAAMVGNFALTRAYLGFLLGAVFYLAAAVCQAVFTNSALLAVSEDSLPEQELGSYKRAVLFWTETVAAVILCLLAFSLPLPLLVYDAHAGISWSGWLGSGLRLGLICLLLVLIAGHFLNAALLKRQVYTRENPARYWHNHRLKQRCALLLLGLWLLTFLGHYAATAGFSPYQLAEGTVFEDWDSFKAYMEQPIAYTHPSHAETTPIRADVAEAPSEVPVGEPTYYNEFGIEITKEEAFTRTVENGKGEVVCTYLAYNEAVASIRYGGGETMLPVKVITFDEIREARAEIRWRNLWFFLGYGLELIAAAVLYGMRRAKQ